MPRQLALWSVTPTMTSSPYIRDLAGAIERSGWRIEHLTLRSIATSSAQIVHVQWPEHVSRGSGRTSTLMKHARVIPMAIALAVRNHHVVLTAHNREPHGTFDAVDTWFRRFIERRARATILLVASHEEPLRQDGALHNDSRVVTIAHPTHPPTDPQPRAAVAQRSRLVILGQIHPYHQILEFVEALDRSGRERPVLVIGGVGDHELLAKLEAFASTRAWLDVQPGFADDSVLRPLLEDAVALVSLQRNSFNSGGPFYALPRHIPVVMTAGDQADDIARSTGIEWVYSVPQEVSALDVDDFEGWLSMTRGEPDLGRFDVDLIAQQHIELYVSLRR